MKSIQLEFLARKFKYLKKNKSETFLITFKLWYDNTCWKIIEFLSSYKHVTFPSLLGKIRKPKKIFHKSSTQLSKQIHQQPSAMNVRTEELVTTRITEGNIFCTFPPHSPRTFPDSLFTMGNFETTFKSKVYFRTLDVFEKILFSTQIFTTPSLPIFVEFQTSKKNMACWRHHLSISCHAS